MRRTPTRFMTNLEASQNCELKFNLRYKDFSTMPETKNLFMFKLLAGGFEQTKPGSVTDENPAGVAERFLATDATNNTVIAETDLAARFGNNKFLFLGMTDDADIDKQGRLRTSRGQLDKNAEIALLEQRLNQLKGGGQVKFDNTPSNSIADKERVASMAHDDKTQQKAKAVTQLQEAESSYGKLDDCTVAELHEIAKEYKVSLQGATRKDEIADRLRDELGKTNAGEERLEEPA